MNPSHPNYPRQATSYPAQSNRPTHGGAPSASAVGGVYINQRGVVNQTVGSTNTIAVKTSSVPVYPGGRYANATLAVLGDYESRPDTTTTETISLSEDETKKRRAKCLSDLERLVPPLFLYAKNIYKNNYEDTDGDGDDNDDELNRNKKRKGGEHEKSIEDATSEANNKPDEGGNDKESDYLQSLKEELKQYQLQNEQLKKRRNSVLKSMVTLHEMYETGLDSIAKANDLRNVPDNVMMDKVV